MNAQELDYELLRLRKQLDNAQTMVAELEALIGAPFSEALNAGVDRVEAGQPYALLEVLEKLRGAFHKVAQDRNKWRAQAKRLTLPEDEHVIAWECMRCGRALESDTQACPYCGYTTYRLIRRKS